MKYLAATAATVVVAGIGGASGAFAAADTGPNSNPSCMGLFSSASDVRGDLSRAYYAELAAHSGANPGELYHSLVGAPGEHC